MVFRDKKYDLHPANWHDLSTKDDVVKVTFSSTLHLFVESVGSPKGKPKISFDQDGMILWFERPKGRVRELLAFTYNPDIYMGALESARQKGGKDNHSQLFFISSRSQKEPRSHD